MMHNDSLIKNQPLHLALTRLNQWLPALWVGSIPLGVSTEAIFMVLAILCILAQPNTLTELRQFTTSKWFYSLLSILIWTSLSLFWAPSIHHESLSVVKKLMQFFLIPIFMLGFTNQSIKDRALHCFLISSLLPLCISAYKFTYVFQWVPYNDPGQIFYNHILTGFIAAFAAYVSLSYYLETKKNIYLLPLFLFTIQIFILNTGKMAYVEYFILTLFAIWPHTSNRLKILSLLAIIGLSFILLICSPNVYQNVQSTLHDLQIYQQGQKATSLGFRAQFFSFAFQLFQKHWLIGNGPGSYYYWFQQLNPVPEWPFAPNAHNQYLFILAEEGIMGLGLWIIFFYNLWPDCHFKLFFNRIFSGFLLLIIISGLTDTVLNVSCPSYLLIAMAAIALSPNQKSSS